MNDEKKRERAREMRYKRPIIKGLTLELIQSELYDIQAECDDIRFFVDEQTDVLDSMIGDDEEAEEFKAGFSILASDCEQMLQDLDEEYLPDWFETFFPAVDSYDDMAGYDAYDDDYMPLSRSLYSAAQAEAQSKIMRQSKEKLLDGACRCFAVFRNYVSIRYRYDCLKASMDILRDQNGSQLKIAKQINELYDKAEIASDHFKYDFVKEVKELQKLFDQLPQEVWLM